jgi:hypothetical protein
MYVINCYSHILLTVHYFSLWLLFILFCPFSSLLLFCSDAILLHEANITFYVCDNGEFVMHIHMYCICTANIMLDIRTASKVEVDVEFS